MDFMTPLSDQCRWATASLIMISALHKSVGCFKYLMLSGASLDQTASIEDTMIYSHWRQQTLFDLMSFAISGGSSEIIHILEQEGIKPEQEHIYFAIENHHPDIFDWLVDRFPSSLTEDVLLSCVRNSFAHGIQFFKQGPLSNIFLNSCISGLIEIVQAIISSGKLTFNNSESKSNEDYSPLYYASAFGHIEIVRLLLNSGNINVNEKAPLLPACVNKHKEIIHLLISHPNCDPNIIIHNGEYEAFPLMGAVQFKNYDIVRLLLTYPNVDVNNECMYDQQCDIRHNSLMAAYKSGDLEMIDILLSDPRINVNKIVGGEIESCPLIYAIEGKSMEAVKKLLARKEININIAVKDFDGTDINVEQMLRQFLESTKSD